MNGSSSEQAGLTQLCVRPACFVCMVFGMMQKAAEGEPSAAKMNQIIQGLNVLAIKI